MTVAHHEFNPHSVWTIVSTIGITAAVGFGCSLLALPEYLSAAISGGAALVPGAISYSRWKAARGSAADLQALGRGELERPIAIVITLTAVVLFLVESVVSFLFGTAVDLALWGTGATAEQVWQAVAVVTLMLASPTFLALSFVVARRAAHYAWPTPFRWLALAVLGYLIIRVVVALAYIFGSGVASEFDLVVSVMAMVVVALVVLLMTWLGCLAARRSHSRFVAGRLFRRLPAEDQATVLAILRDVVAVRPPVTPSAARDGE